MRGQSLLFQLLANKHIDVPDIGAKFSLNPSNRLGCRGGGNQKRGGRYREDGVGGVILVLVSHSH